jgi:tight adherence protein B
MMRLAFVLVLAMALFGLGLSLRLLWKAHRTHRRIDRALAALSRDPAGVAAVPPRSLAGPALPALLVRLAPDAAARALLEAWVAARGAPPAPLALMLALAIPWLSMALPLWTLGIAPIGAVALATLLLPLLGRLLLGRLGARRRAALLAQLPDALALLVRGLRAGVPLSAAIAEAAREVPTPLGAELSRVSERVGLGQPIEAALWAMARRAGLAEVDFLCVTVALQRETGGNLAITLAELEAMVRKREALGLKVRALSAEARTSAFIIGALPVLMALGLAVLAPDYLAPMLQTGPGRMLLAAALLSLGTGALVMAQLVRTQAGRA